MDHFSKRIFATLALCLTFFFFSVSVVHATPVLNLPTIRSVGIVPRGGTVLTDLSTANHVNLVARCNDGSCSCATPGCNEQAILDILINLKVTIDILVKGLDGHGNPFTIVAEICATLNAAARLLAAVEVNLSTAGSLLLDIVNILVSIILALGKCVTAYGPTIAITLALQIDLALASLLFTCNGLIPTLGATLSAALKDVIGLLQAVKFILTLLACNLPL